MHSIVLYMFVKQTYIMLVYRQAYNKLVYTSLWQQSCLIKAVCLCICLYQALHKTSLLVACASTLDKTGLVLIYIGLKLVFSICLCLMALALYSLSVSYLWLVQPSIYSTAVSNLMKAFMPVLVYNKHLYIMHVNTCIWMVVGYISTKLINSACI